MPADVRIGQKWSTWGSEPGTMAAPQQSFAGKDGQNRALQYDDRYGIGRGHDEHGADETTMLENTSLFRLISS